MNSAHLSMSPHPIADCVQQLTGDELIKYRSSMSNRWKSFMASNSPTHAHFVLRNLVMGFDVFRGCSPTTNFNCLRAGRDPYFATKSALWRIACADPTTWNAFVDLNWSAPITPESIWSKPDDRMIWSQYIQRSYREIEAKSFSLSDASVKQRVCSQK